MFIDTFKNYYLSAMRPLTRVSPLKSINTFTIRITNISRSGQLKKEAVVWQDTWLPDIWN
jgi:hypothetical protein